MARGRRSGAGQRGASRTANPRVAARSYASSIPSLSVFDDDWLNSVREGDPDFIDLGSVEDRRRYAPGRIKPAKTVRGLRARIVVVPEGHRLARLQTYGGRYSINEVRASNQRYPLRKKARWQLSEWIYGNVRAYALHDDVPKRVGFHMPWQVVICVRRKRRKEVLFAKRKTGAGARARVRRRNEYSDVRC